MTKREQEVLDSMRGIIDPDLGRDIVSLGFIKELEVRSDNTVRFLLELTTPACPIKDEFQEACRKAVSALPWVRAVEIRMGARAKAGGLRKSGAGMAKVQHVVAVASCKGGVGKSTVAVNLAYALAQRGASIGIFDADIYGPSLPTMVRTAERGLRQTAGGLIQPVLDGAVRLMSFAYASPGKDTPAVMRGPMVTSVVNQLLTTTDWGALDYLVIDMPPGTGDIQLTLAQIIPIAAAVIVTTPQEISFVDVVKGIRMFDMMHVPTVAVVENMSYFVCDGCGKEHRLFGAGAMRRIVEQFGIRNAIELPLDPAVAAHSDRGIPLVAAQPDHGVSRGYRALADSVIREISRITLAPEARPVLRYEAGEGLIFNAGSGADRLIEPQVLRKSCRCAACVDEKTGNKVLRDEDVPSDIVPTKVEPMGNYAVSIAWSDGHGSIYPFDYLAQLTRA